MKKNQSGLARLKTPAILFEPDGYSMAGDKLMGRQSAGNGFLRAAVNARQDDVMWAYTPNQASAEYFSKLVKQLDSSASCNWVSPANTKLLADIGSLYLPGPGLSHAAHLRLHAGPASYSLTGITHTTASHQAMDAISGLLGSAIMPWDAVICTSKAVLQTVNVILESQKSYLEWSTGTKGKFHLPQLPVIPLGVHAQDYEFNSSARLAARKGMHIQDDEIVLLFVGRLSFHAKAHPHQMYCALQEVASKTNKKITLIQTGWFANKFIEEAFVGGANTYCPDVKTIYLDGKDAELVKSSWAAADIFISLSDNVQETFGLTPIEAMAAGLPVIVSDWDGYKDTVRDGVDGYRIPTWMPDKTYGEKFSISYEADMLNYDMYCGYLCQAVAVDMAELILSLTELVKKPELRKAMGAAGKKHVLENFDWKVVYQRYQELWLELERIRTNAVSDPYWLARIRSAPSCASGRINPFAAFEHYPTFLVTGDSLISALVHANILEYQKVSSSPLFDYAKKIIPNEDVAKQIIENAVKPISISELALKLGISLQDAIQYSSMFVKMNLLKYERQ